MLIGLANQLWCCCVLALPFMNISDACIPSVLWTGTRDYRWSQHKQ